MRTNVYLEEWHQIYLKTFETCQLAGTLFCLSLCEIYDEEIARLVEKGSYDIAVTAQMPLSLFNFLFLWSFLNSGGLSKNHVLVEES